MGLSTVDLKKAIVCAFLSIILIAGLLPINASADENQNYADVDKAIIDDTGANTPNDENADIEIKNDALQQDKGSLDFSDSQGKLEESLNEEEVEDSASSKLVESATPLANDIKNDTVLLASTAHIQNIGDKSYSAAQSVTLGTTGQSKRLEAFTLSLQNNTDINGSIQYRAHIQNIGWQGVKNSGEVAGTEGKSLRIEAVRIALIGELAKQYDVYYRAHVQNFGWLTWASNGAPAGSEGYSNRLEALEIVLIKKDNVDQLKQLVQNKDTIDNTNAFKFAEITYRDHCQNTGWRNHTASSLEKGITLGTRGQSKRLEAFAIIVKRLNSNSFTDLNKSIYRDGSITYQAHVQNIGWQSTQKDGSTAGTVNRALRIEAVKFTLAGDLAKDYKVYYRTHVSNIGNLGWTEGNNESGTTGASARVEAVDIQLVRNGTTPPTSNQSAFLTNSMVQTSYGALPTSSNWVNTAQGGTAGTTGQSRAVVAIQAAISKAPVSGGIQYRTHVANAGWLGYISNGESRNGSKPVQAIQMKLTGELSKYYDIYYRAHVSGYGWMGWAKNGASSGTTGLNKNLEAYQVRVVVKGSPVPGSTTRSFSDQNGFLGVPPAHRAFVNKANQYSSLTRWIILVDTNAHKAAILSGSRGNWKISRQFSVTTGAPSTPTIKGVFQTTGFKRMNLSTDSRARWCTQIKGGYFFHTILASTNELGKSQSHGCVRLAIPDAQWIYNNIGRGTTVVIY